MSKTLAISIMMKISEKFKFVYQSVLEKGICYDFQNGLVIKKWLVSDGVESSCAPFANFSDANLNCKFEDPLLFKHAHTNKSWREQWVEYTDKNAWLTYLRGLNNGALVICGSFALKANKPSRAVFRFYNKANIRIWQNNKLVFIGKKDIKYLDEHLLINLEPGYNYFLVEKTALSIYLTINDYDQDYSESKKYLTEDFLSSRDTELSIVTDDFFYRKSATLNIVVFPRNSALNTSEDIVVTLKKEKNVVAICKCHPFVPVKVALPDQVTGKVDIIASFGNSFFGQQRIYVGKVLEDLSFLENEIENYKECTAREISDIRLWIKDLREIFTFEETGVYESRRSNMEEINALIEGLESLMKNITEEKELQKTLKTGLNVKSFQSQLDQSVQYYYTYVPKNYDSQKQYPILILLKFLTRKVQLPGFIYNDGLKSTNKDLCPIIVCPTGRGMNRYEFAGEIDILEVIKDLKKRYSVNPDRLFLAGFSSGGGACWNLAQKYPSLFHGIITWGSSPNLPYVNNLKNTKIIYINADQDQMFNSPENHNAVVESSKTVKYNSLLLIMAEKTTHFCLSSIYNDRKLLDWIGTDSSFKDDTTVNFRTDNLYHAKSYWISLENSCKPSKESSVFANFLNSDMLSIECQNVSILGLSTDTLVKFGTTTIRINGKLLKDIKCRANKPMLYVSGIGGQTPLRSSYGLKGKENFSGLGILEIYYGSVAVIVSEEPDSTKKRAYKRLATAFSRPIYYADIREKYSTISVIKEDSFSPTLLENRHTIFLGDHWENTAICKLCNKEVIKKVLSSIDKNILKDAQVIITKMPGLANNFKIVSVIVKNVQILKLLAPELLIGKFSPPFSSEKSILRNDVIILTHNKIVLANFDPWWSLTEVLIKDVKINENTLT